MTEYEQLLNIAEENHVNVYEQYDFSGTRIKGLYCDGCVAISRELDTNAEKKCILAEELGHYHTTAGNILDSAEASNRKQEMHARLWAYNRQIGLDGIISCHKARCKTLHDMALHLDVTENFLADALECYRQKYGIYTIAEPYIICFEPHLYVLERVYS